MVIAKPLNSLDIQLYIWEELLLINNGNILQAWDEKMVAILILKSCNNFLIFINIFQSYSTGIFLKILKYSCTPLIRPSFSFCNEILVVTSWEGCHLLKRGDSTTSFHLKSALIKRAVFDGRGLIGLGLWCFTPLSTIFQL